MEPGPQHPTIAARHISNPARKAIEAAALALKPTEVAKLVADLPELMHVRTPMLIGTKLGKAIAIAGTWSRKHLNNELKLLDATPRRSPDLRDAHLLYASDDVSRALGPNAARDHIAASNPGLPAGTFIDNAGYRYWEFEPLTIHPRTTQHLAENVAMVLATNSIRLADRMPLIEARNKTIFSTNPTSLEDYFDSLRRIAEAMFEDLNWYCSQSLHLKRDDGNDNFADLFLRPFLMPFLLSPLVGDEMIRENFVAVHEEKGFRAEPILYGMISHALWHDPTAARSRGAVPPIEHIEALIPAQSSLANLYAVPRRPAVVLHFPHTQNPVGQPGILFAGFVSPGEKVIPPVGIVAPVATAERPHFYALFIADRTGESWGGIYELETNRPFRETLLNPSISISRAGGEGTNPKSAVVYHLALLGLEGVYHSVTQHNEAPAQDAALYKQLWLDLSRSYPQLVDRFSSPYRAKSGHPSPLKLQYGWATRLLRFCSVPGSTDGTAEANYFYTEICESLKYGNQIFYVSDQLATVLSLTDFDPDSDFFNAAWPFPAFTLMFGDKSPTGKVAVTLHRVSRGAVYQESVTTTATFTGPKIVATADGYAIRSSTGDMLTLCENDPSFDITIGKVSSSCKDYIEDGSLAPHLLAIKVLLFLQHFPAALSGNRVMKRETRAPSGETTHPATFHPRTIDIPKCSETNEVRTSAARAIRSARAKICGHWRRGHTRQQAYGPSHSLRREKFIWPCFIGDSSDSNRK